MSRHNRSRRSPLTIPRSQLHAPNWLVYAGIQQQKGAFPIQYVQASVPQAWAAGSIFHLLQAILGLQADAPNHQLFVDPELPAWLPDITLHQLTIGKATLDLRFWRDGEQTLHTTLL